MARRPFFGQNDTKIAKMDMQAATAPGRAYGDMFKSLGEIFGGAIEKYQLNKEKRAKLTDKIENRLRLDPSIAQRLTMTGDENYDKKNTTYMEKLSQGELGLKGLESLDSAMATIKEVDLQKQQDQVTALNNKLLRERVLTSKEARKVSKELSDFKKLESERKESTYKAYDRQLDDLQNRILNGAKYEDFSAQDRLILGNSAGITNRTLDLNELIYDPSKDLDFQTAKQEFENIKKQGKKSELEISEKEAEIARTPDFTDRDSALASTSDLPEGVSADIKKYKDGFNVEYKYKAKEFTDIPSVPGFPNYKIVGGYVYEGDPKTKKLTKLGSENFGEKSELLQKAITSLTTKDVEQYGLAKFRGVQNDDNDYEVEDPASGETIVVPFNQDLENRLIYLDSLRNKLRTQLDIDLDLTIQ
jgi:hypothetical protein